MSSVGTSVVIEGAVKYRDGKKWKPRWCVVRKLSPVADCLHLQLYRDVKDKDKQCQTKASLSLEGFLALECGFTLDKESNTLALICPELVVILAFDTRETLIEWQVKMRAHLEEDQQFIIHVSHVPQRSKITPGPARLHLQDMFFCLTAGLPPKLLGHWQLQDLRRYGVVGGKFCFEGGSRCGRGEGLHVLLSNQAEQISAFFELASQGKLHLKSRALSRRNSVLESTGQRTIRRPGHWSATLSSTESRRPFLTTSTSDTTADMSLQPSAAGLQPDDQEPSKEGYLWRSGSGGSGSRSGSASGSAASNNDVDSVETMSLAISDIPDVNGGNLGPHDWLAMTPCSTDADHGDMMMMMASCRCSSTSKSGLFTPSPTQQHYSAPRTCAEMAYYDRPRNVLVQQDVGGCWTIPGSPRRTAESVSSSPREKRRMPSPPPPCQPPTRPQTPPAVTVDMATRCVPPTLIDGEGMNRRCPCATCGPYANYAVPRSTLCRVKGHEKQQLTWGCDQGTDSRERYRLSVTSSDSSADYDYPKKIKECLRQNGSCPICGRADSLDVNAALPERCISHGTAHVSGIIPCSCLSTWKTPETCPCQKVLYWAEKLLCEQRQEQESCKRVQSETLRVQPTVTECDTNPVLEHGVAQTRSVNYANLEFVDTLGLYENAAAILSRVDGTDVTLNGTNGNDTSMRKPVAAENDHKNEVVKCCHCGNMIGNKEVPARTPEPEQFQQFPSRLETETETVLVPVTDEINSDDDGNYLPMQPACIPRALLRKQEHESPFSEYMSMTRERCCSYDRLPLRTFMPLEIPGAGQMDYESVCSIQGNRDSCARYPGEDWDKKSPLAGVRTARSNSVVELKRRVLFLRKRSSSADGRRDKPPVKVPSEDANLHKRETVEEVLRGPDLDGSPIYAQIRTDKKSPTSTNLVMRSACVPCNKSATNRDSASSSDSGVSTCSPRSLLSADGVSGQSVPPPLPPRNVDRSDVPDGVICRNIVGQRQTPRNAQGIREHRMETDAGSPVTRSPATSRKNLDEFGVSRCHTPVTEAVPPANCAGDSKSNTSSTVSDLSDFIETLSLSSHGSADGYGSTSLTNTLRPRSGREYQKMDRIALDDFESVKSAPTEYAQNPQRQESR